MSDIFLKPDVLDLLDNKFILMIGDSNIKSIYKDLLYLYTQNDIAPPSFFRTTGGQDRWESCCGDTVLHLPSVVTAGRDNFEEREYRDDHVQIRFHFVTKVYGKAMRCVLKLIEDGSIPMPNIVVMNSCIWDLTRWGPKQEDNYKKDLISLFSKIRKILSGDTLIIWSSTLPIAVEQCKGGIFIKQLEFMRHSLRFMILEANKLTQHLCVAFEIDFLDLHYHMRYQLHRRAIDGIHWETHAIRMLTNLILTHIALSFDVPLPGHVRTGYLKSAIDKAAEVNTPPDLNKIGFHKDMQDQIEDELKRIVPTSCQNKPNKNADDSETSDRVFRNAKRRVNVVEKEEFSIQSQSSKYVKLSPIRFPLEKATTSEFHLKNEMGKTKHPVSKFDNRIKCSKIKKKSKCQSIQAKEANNSDIIKQKCFITAEIKAVNVSRNMRKKRKNCSGGKKSSCGAVKQSSTSHEKVLYVADSKSGLLDNKMIINASAKKAVTSGVLNDERSYDKDKMGSSNGIVSSYSAMAKKRRRINYMGNGRGVALNSVSSPIPIWNETHDPNFSAVSRAVNSINYSVRNPVAASSSLFPKFAASQQRIFDYQRLLANSSRNNYTANDANPTLNYLYSLYRPNTSQQPFSIPFRP